MNILNLPDKIMQTIRTEIEKALSVMPVSIPCKVKSRTANTVDCTSLVNFKIPTTVLTNVPIIQSKYYNYPVKADDIGLLIPLSYSYSNTLLGLSNLEAIPSGNMQNFYFLPLTKTLDEVMNIEDSVITSQDGKNILTISDKNVTIDVNGKKVLITIDTLGSITIDAEKEIIINSKDKVTLNAEKPIAVNGKDKLDMIITGDVNIKTDGIATVEAKGDAFVKGKNVTVEAQTTATVKNSACKVEIASGGVDINAGALKVMP